MSQQNPIDDLFRRRLEGHSEPAPMHLWDGIVEKRNWRHRLAVRLRRNQVLVGAIIAGVVAGLLIAGLARYDQPVIKSFPIPMPGAQPASLPVAPAVSEHLATATIKTEPSAKAVNSKISTAIVATPQTNPPPAPPQRQQALSTTPAAPSSAKRQPLPTTPLTTQKEQPTAMTKDIAPKRIPFSMLKPTASAFDAPTAPKLDLDLLTKTECADFDDHSIRFSVDLLLSPNFALRELEARSAEYIDYARDRENTESPVFAYSASARISATTAWGLALRTGLTYSQINERFEYLNEQEERIVITNIRDNDGNIIGTDTLVELGTRQVKTNNRYRMLDVPILAGYEFSHQKFGFSVNGGILLNLLFDQKGDMLSPDDRMPVTFTQGEAGQIRPFRDRLAMGWYGSLGVTYELNKNLDLLVEPYFRIDPQSFTRSDFLVSQRYFTTGLSVGLRKML